MIERVAGAAPDTKPQPKTQREGDRRLFRITVSYHGGAYAGWQVQPDAVTVQGVLERAVERLNGRPTRILGAGRTDAGVHARGQAARVEIARDITEERLPAALNAFLPDDIVVLAAKSVDAQFHPIRDALWKHYRYTFRVAPYDDPFDRDRVYRISESLNVAAMRQTAASLVGEHDFAAFEKKGSPRDTTVRHLRRLDVVRDEDYIHLHLVANGFLYGMARNLAGTILRVGRGNLPPIATSEEAPEPERNELGRAAPEAMIPADAPTPQTEGTSGSGAARGGNEIAGPCLPARGLCLMQVVFAED